MLDAQLKPDHRYFKIRGDDEARSILRNDAPVGRWELTIYNRSVVTG